MIEDKGGLEMGGEAPLIGRFRPYCTLVVGSLLRKERWWMSNRGGGGRKDWTDAVREYECGARMGQLERGLGLA